MALLTVAAGSIVNRFIMKAWDSVAQNLPYMHSAKAKRDLIADYNQKRYSCERARLLLDEERLEFDREKFETELAEKRKERREIAEQRLEEIRTSKELDFFYNKMPIEEEQKRGLGRQPRRARH